MSEVSKQMNIWHTKCLKGAGSMLCDKSGDHDTGRRQQGNVFVATVTLSPR